MVSDFISDLKGINNIYRDWYRDYFKDGLVPALEGIEQVSGYCFTAQASDVVSKVASSVLPIFCVTEFTDSFEEKSRLIALIAAPSSIKYLSGAVAAHFSIAADAQKKVSIRLHNLAKGILNAAFLGAMGWSVHAGLKIIGNKIVTAAPQVLTDTKQLELFSSAAAKVAEAAPGVFSVVTSFYSMAIFVRPLVHISEIYQVAQLELGREVDQGVIKDCFGKDAVVFGDAERIQLAKYKKVKMILTANALVKLVAEKVLILSVQFAPVGYIALFSATAVKLGMEFYWERQVKKYKKEEVAAEKYGVLKTVTAFSTYASLPFTSLPDYAPYALGVLAISSSTNLFLRTAAA